MGGGPVGWQQERLEALGQSRVGSNKREPVIWRKPVIKAETGDRDRNPDQVCLPQGWNPRLHVSLRRLVRGRRREALLEWTLGRRRRPLAPHHPPFFPEVGVGGRSSSSACSAHTPGGRSRVPSVQGGRVEREVIIIWEGELGVRWKRAVELVLIAMVVTMASLSGTRTACQLCSERPYRAICFHVCHRAVRCGYCDAH